MPHRPLPRRRRGTPAERVVGVALGEDAVGRDGDKLVLPVPREVQGRAAVPDDPRDVPRRVVRVRETAEGRAVRRRPGDVMYISDSFHVHGIIPPQ